MGKLLKLLSTCTLYFERHPLEIEPHVAVLSLLCCQHEIWRRQGALRKCLV
jgi:hypothetical protein